MSNVHEVVQSRQWQGPVEPADAFKGAAQAVIGLIAGIPWDGLGVASLDDRPQRINELLFNPDSWPGARRAAITLLAGDIAAWCVDGQGHIALLVLLDEIEEWASGLQPEGITLDRLRVYAAVTQIDRGTFASTMAALVDDAFAVVRASWSVIQQVADALQARGYLTADDLQQLVDGTAVAPVDGIVEGDSDVN